MKRYFVKYESDQMICRSFDHIYGNASSIKTAKQYISRCRKTDAEYNPRNFRIYDSWADVDPATDFVPCVYQED
jgi:hypothetical protein